MQRRLYRSDTNRMFAGVCGGLGEYLDVDPTIVRLLFVLAVLAGFGSGVIFYIILMIIMPLKDQPPVAQVEHVETPKDTSTTTNS